MVFRLIACFVAVLIVGTGSRLQAGETKTRLPNIVYILADDLGYGELGSYGQQKIKTPNLDKLAARGMRFTQHYSGNAACAPSRCVLLTGLHHGHALVRNNVEQRPEGQFPLPPRTVTLARLLRYLGYVTGAFGKWGLGGPDSTGLPDRQGFDRFFGYLCQGKAHNSYPPSLWDDRRRVPLENPAITIGDKLADGADPNAQASYRRFQGTTYVPDVIAAQSLQFIRDNKDRPSFLFVPTTVPHLALQVPDDSLKEYAGQWDDPPYVGGKGYLPHHTPRAAYAAMVTRLDREVGRIMALLSELGLDDDTIIIFSSDNGPLGARYAGTDSIFFNSTRGLRGFKGSLFEGGIRVPCLIAWPGHIPAGKTSDRVTGFEDWLPTLLDLIGRPDATPAGLDGISFAPTLLGKMQPPRPFLYREFPDYGGQQMVRLGNWTGVRQNLLPAKNATPVVRTELYNLRDDPSQKTDVAAQHPDIVAQIEQLFRAQHTRSEAFPLPALDKE